MAETHGPIIVWEDLGCEGWQPKSYATLKEAVYAPRYSGAAVITRVVEFDVVEAKPPLRSDA